MFNNWAVVLVLAGEIFVSLPFNFIDSSVKHLSQRN